MKIQDLIEGWSQKYKKSINCSHPKGFSQKAHCAGKKKHNESVETHIMEMVCENCGMCESHGNLNEIKKGAKDSNGYTKCWPGKHAEGTKKGKNGGQVRNCVPNESVEQGVAEGLGQDYLSQIPNLSWKSVSRNVWNIIQDEGLDEEQDTPSHRDWVMASLSIDPKDAQALMAFENDAIEDFNRFDIHLKSRYPGLTDLIDYDRGTVTIVKPINKQGVAEGMQEETYDGDEFFEAYGELWYNEDEQLDEAEYHGRNVQLGKPMQGDVKKFKVYVKDPSTGNIKKVNFGDPNMRIKKSNPARRRSFRARHNCDNPGPRTSARYWSCRKW